MSGSGAEGVSSGRVDESEEQERIAISPARKLAFLGVLMLGLLVALEVLLTSLVGATVIAYGPKKGGVRTPFIPGSRAELVAPEFHVDYRINRLGYRDYERELEKAPGRLRVTVLGDSFTEGWGVEQSEAFPRVAEQRLPGCEVWNLGRHGGNPLWYAIQIDKVLAEFAPDVVLVQLFDNDPWDIKVYRRRFTFAEDLSVTGERGDRSLPSALEVWWSRRQLVRFWKKVRRSLKDRRPMFAEPFYRPGVRPRRPALSEAELAARFPEDRVRLEQDKTLGYLDAMDDDWRAVFRHEEAALRQVARRCREAGVAFVMLYIPSRRVFQDWSSADAALAAHPHQRLLRRLARELDCPLVDLATDWRHIGVEPTGLYHRWDGHLNRAGHRRLGRRLAVELVRRVPRIAAKAEAR